MNPKLLAAALAHAAGDDDEAEALPVSVQAKRLCAFAERYARFLTECEFKVGDLVTPREDGCYKGGGQPHLVVEVARGSDNLPPAPKFSERDGSHRDGARYDIRVAVLHGESIILYWGESFQHERWNGTIAA